MTPCTILMHVGVNLRENTELIYRAGPSDTYKLYICPLHRHLARVSYRSVVTERARD